MERRTDQAFAWRLRAGLEAIRMALDDRKPAASAARFHATALAWRRAAGGQDHPRPRRTGVRRHSAICTVLATACFAWRRGGVRSAAQPVAAAFSDGRRASRGGARRT